MLVRQAAHDDALPRRLLDAHLGLADLFGGCLFVVLMLMGEREAERQQARRRRPVTHAPHTSSTQNDKLARGYVCTKCLASAMAYSSAVQRLVMRLATT